MLLIDIEMTRAVEPGANVAELVEVTTKRVQLAAGGFRNDPVLAGAVAKGLPTSSPYPETPAPIELQPGDLVRLSASYDEPGVVAVLRKGRTIYPK